MSILDRLLSVLGLGGADDRGDREPTVTVEHDPDATDEAAVKGVDVGEGDGSTAGDGTDVAGAGESGGDEGKPEADAEASAETANADAVPASGAAEPTDADVETGADAETGTDADVGSADTPIEPAVEADDAGSQAPDPHAAEGADESVETVKGIGPAYADRLAGAGVETLGDLAAADAADLADRISLSEKRVSRWIDRARGRLDLE